MNWSLCYIMYQNIINIVLYWSSTDALTSSSLGGTYETNLVPTSSERCADGNATNPLDTAPFRIPSPDLTLHRVTDPRGRYLTRYWRYCWMDEKWAKTKRLRRCREIGFPRSRDRRPSDLVRRDHCNMLSRGTRAYTLQICPRSSTFRYDIRRFLLWTSYV